MDNIDLKISEEINNTEKPKEKGLYRRMEDSYYNTLDKINKSIPIYKIIDPIDKIMPSFILVNILLFLFIIAIIGLLIFFILNSGMKVDIEFYYDNTKLDKDLLVNISYTEFDKNYDVKNGLLTLKLKEDLSLKLKVLTKDYEFERSYVITEDYIKVNIPKKIVVDTNPKKINIFAYESPNTSKIYSQNITLSLRCFNSGKMESISLSGTKEYEKAYDCGNIKFTGNVSGFRPIDYTCNDSETVCAIPLTKLAEQTPQEVDLTPKNNLEVYVKDGKNNVLKNVVVSLSKGSTIIPDKNTDLYGKVVYPNLPVGVYELELHYDTTAISKYLKDSNVYVSVSNLPIRKDYVLNLDKNYETESILRISVDTFDDNASRFDLYIFDINGAIKYSQKNKSVPFFNTTNLKSNVYYVSAVPSDKYNPIYFEEFELFQDTNLEVIFEEYDVSKFFKLAVYGDDIAGAKVTIKEIDNNNLVYDSKIADSTNRAIFDLYADRDYFVEVIKNNFVGYGTFKRTNINKNIGEIEISLEKMKKEISFEFTLDNKKVDYIVFVDADDDTNYSGNGKINFKVPTGEKIELNVVAEDGFDVYTYFLSPMIFSEDIKYNLKYNYNTSLNVKATDLKLDLFLQKDVNDLNLIVNKKYYFGLEAKLNCASNKVTRDIPYVLTQGFDLVSKNDYLDLGNNLLSLSVTNTLCKDNAIIYHYIFNSILELTAKNSGLEGYFEYDDYLDKNIYFKVPGSYQCDVSLNDKLITSSPQITSLGKTIAFGENCGSILLNEEPLEGLEYTFDNLGKYVFSFYDKNVSVYVLNSNVLASNKSPFEEIKVLYDNEVDCTEYYCSVEQFYENYKDFSNILLLNDNYAGLRIEDLSDRNDVNFNGVGEYYCTAWVCNLVKLTPKNHIFYNIPFRELILISELSDPFGSGSNVSGLKWNNNLEVPIITNNSNIYHSKINFQNISNYNTVLFAQILGNNFIDLKLSKGIDIKICEDILDCYYKNSKYYLFKDNVIYDAMSVLDINNVSEEISLKQGFEDLSGERFIIIKPKQQVERVDDSFIHYKIDSLQDVIDNYNNKLIYHVFNESQNSFNYVWDLDYIIRKTINPNYVRVGSILVNPLIRRIIS